MALQDMAGRDSDLALTRDGSVLSILYATQTGTAEDVAEMLAAEARRRGIPNRTIAMNEYDVTRLPSERFAVFVVATTGQGEEPDAMKGFWKFLLRKSLPSDSLAGSRFAVFGLGDSSYARFNFPAKKLHKRLLQLGATAVIERGDGDDQHPLGLDGALDPWMAMLWQALDPLFPGAKEEVRGGNEIDPPSFRISFLDDVADGTLGQASAVPVDVPQDGAVDAILKSNERITSPSHFQDVRHIVLSLPEAAEAAYGPGDVLHLRPRNLASSVEAFLDRLGWTEIGDKPFRLQASPARPLPLALDRPLTLRNVLTSYLDAFGRPRRHFFGMLAPFCSDTDHREKLIEFASAEGQRDLYAYCHRPKRTAFEVLLDFSSASFPPDYLFDLFPPLRPRAFSISSSPLVHRGEAHLTVAIVAYRTKLSIPRRGICTSYLAELEHGSRIKVWFSKGTLKLPADGGPVIMIAPGTGLAPMRALLEERICHNERDNMLFLGIRNVEGDYFYRDQLETWETEGKLRLYVAASRDQAAKIYVQHRIAEHGAELWSKMQDPRCTILLSGSSGRMPQDVEAALVAVIRDHGGLDDDAAKAFLAQIEKQKRWIQECWS